MTLFGGLYPENHQAYGKKIQISNLGTTHKFVFIKFAEWYLWCFRSQSVFRVVYFSHIFQLFCTSNSWNGILKIWNQHLKYLAKSIRMDKVLVRNNIWMKNFHSLGAGNILCDGGLRKHSLRWGFEETFSAMGVRGFYLSSVLQTREL